MIKQSRPTSNSKKGHDAATTIEKDLPMILRAALLLLMYCGCQVSNAQLINIESQRLQSDTTGWKGSVGTAFSFNKNTLSVLSISADAHVQYKTLKNVYLLLADYNLLKSENQQLSDNVFFHLRYNRKMGKILRWEAFTQWQRNAITNIRLRALAGTGPRFKLHDSKKLKLYLATAAMYEYEEELKRSIIHKDVRNSSYFSFTWLPNDIVSLVTTTYYQPLFTYVGDFRVFNQLSMIVKATKHFSINTSFNYLYDSYPAEGVPLVNYTVTNGFTYRF